MTQRDLVIGTAGHIDHGKTALVRALTGIDTDRLPAEKQRGITIDLGFAALDLDGSRLALVDVPGHERFLRNMLAGATGMDLAMLVVAADDSVMPQTREHLEVLRLLGLPAGVVVLSKCDLVDPSWLALVEEDVKGLVEGTFLEKAAIIRTSAQTGEGIDNLRDALQTLSATAPARRDLGFFRMAIDRAFTVSGYGTVVTGTVASGRIAVGDELEWLPEGRTVRVRGLHRHDRPVDCIGRGARAAVNLVGVHHSEIRRGQELGAPGYLAPSRVLSVTVSASGGGPRSLRHRGRYRVHLGTAEVAGRLALFENTARSAGDSSFAQLFLSEPVTSVSGQPFVLREESPPATVGGGLVLEPSARRVRRRDRVSVARIGRLGSPDPAERAAAALAGSGLSPLTDRGLCREAGLAAAEVSSVLDRLGSTGAVVELAVGLRRSIRVPRDFAAELEDRTVRALARLHAARPRQSSIPRVHVAAELPDLAANDSLVSSLLERLKARGLVVLDARMVALKGHEPRLSQGERRLKTELASSIRLGGFSPPELADLTLAAGSRAAAVHDLLSLLRDEEQVVEISTQLYLDFETVAELHRRVIEALSTAASMTMSDLRQLLGTSRKYAVPIGEYLDRVGLTHREGDHRRLGPAGAEILS